MYDVQKDRLLSLKMLLNEVLSDPVYTHSAGKLRRYLSDKEYEQYRKDLAFYEHEKAQGIEPHLNDEAEDYWFTFKALYTRAGRARTKEQKQRVYNDAQELFGVQERMSPAGLAYLREARSSDKQWKDPLGRTQWDLMVLKDAEELFPHLRHVKHFTQMQTLQDLIGEAEDPIDTAAVVANAEKLMALAKRLAR